MERSHVAASEVSYCRPSLRQAGHREGSCGLSIHCLAMKSLPDMDISHCLAMKSLPDMDISYGNHTECKTPTIAGQLMLLGGICGACASWRSTLFQKVRREEGFGTSSVAVTIVFYVFLVVLNKSSVCAASHMKPSEMAT